MTGSFASAPESSSSSSFSVFDRWPTKVAKVRTKTNAITIVSLGTIQSCRLGRRDRPRDRPRPRRRYRALIVTGEKERERRGRGRSGNEKTRINPRKPASPPDLPLTLDQVLVAGQFFQTHRTAGVQSIGADSDLSPKTKLPAIIEPR
jgi:hypothetical protein